jgi:L-alanine-DL-glutamate epimerase-like enolase superfamily enzyme
MQRRDLLKAISLGTAGLGGLVCGADAEEVRGRVNTRSEPSALKITDLRVVPMYCAMRSYVVRLDTNQGIRGYGEIRDGASATYALMLKSRILGENPCHVDKIFRKLKQFGHHGRQAGGVVAIEMACWDLAGKAWGVPCWQMLGGRFRDRIRMYADTPIRPARLATTPEEFDRPPIIPGPFDPQALGQRLKERRKQGFTFLKMDIGIPQLRGIEGALTYPQGQGVDPRMLARTPFANVPHPFTGIRITERGLKKIAEYIRIIRDIVGWDIPLAADHFGHFGVEDAIKLAQALDPFNLAWLEDMIPWFYTDQYVRLKNSCTTPILTGEDIYLKEGFLPLFEKQAISICQPDLATAGGLLETKKIGDLAMEHGIAMAMHMAGSPVALFASIHSAAATENFLALEYHNADTPYHDDLVEGISKPIVGKDGFVRVPDGPGLGFELSEEAVKDAIRRRGRDPQQEFFPPSDQWNQERAIDRVWS